jgi:hypothetical protein
MAAVPMTPLVADRSGAVNMTTANSTIATAGTPFTFPNSGSQIVRIKATATDTAVTAAYAGNAPDALTVGNKTTPALTATSDILFGPFPVSVYGSVVSLTGPTLATTSFWVIQSADVLN